MNNFPIKLGNKEYWISRSIAVCGFILTGSSENLSILSVKRGSGCPDEVGKWCCPCGYLDYGETLAEACSREIYEECGLSILPSTLKMWDIDSDPCSNKQNVVVSYWDYNPDYFDRYLSTVHSELNEVDNTQWIPLEKVNVLNWAFNHETMIYRLTGCLRYNSSPDIVMSEGILAQIKAFHNIFEPFTLQNILYKNDN